MFDVPVVTVHLRLREISHVVPLLHEESTEDVEEDLAREHRSHLLRHTIEFQVMIPVQQVKQVDFEGNLEKDDDHEANDVDVHDDLFDVNYLFVDVQPVVHQLVKTLVVHYKDHAHAEEDVERVDHLENRVQVLLLVHVVIRIIVNVGHLINVLVLLKQDQESHDQLLRRHEQVHLQVAYHSQVDQGAEDEEDHILERIIVDLG